MSDGWHCEACGTFYADSILHTKITISIEPREYEAPDTLCSLACLEQWWATIKDIDAWAKEHDESKPRIRTFVVDEPIEDE